LIKKIQCQPADHGQFANSTRIPPIGGPNAAALFATTAIKARPSPRCAGGKTRVVIARASGARMPAPTPWMMRKPIRRPAEVESAQSSDPAVNIDSPITKNRLRPNWSASRPIETSRIANVMLYAFSTQETVSTEESRSRSSCGIVMLTIVMSIKAMNRPSITTPQICQRRA
jgi:hypothetical protein